jgi:catechol 2,3-dioxygenase-like lactoylglutathione lyase family enzyme
MPPPILGTLESALYATDLAAAEAFYAGVLGLPVVARVPGRHLFFRTGTSMLLVFDPAATRQPPAPGALPVPPHGAEGAGHYCLTVARTDLDRWRAHLMAAGIAIEAEVTWPRGGRSLYVRDPAGNSVEFADAALWA